MGPAAGTLDAALELARQRLWAQSPAASLSEAAQPPADWPRSLAAPASYPPEVAAAVAAAGSAALVPPAVAGYLVVARQRLRQIEAAAL